MLYITIRAINNCKSFLKFRMYYLNSFDNYSHMFTSWKSYANGKIFVHMEIYDDTFKKPSRPYFLHSSIYIYIISFFSSNIYIHEQEHYFKREKIHKIYSRLLFSFASLINSKNRFLKKLYENSSDGLMSL